MYKCEICEKEHPSITERAQCELACAKRIEEAAKKAAEAKKKEEQNARKAELEEAIQHAQDLFAAYIEDYKSFEFASDDFGYSAWPSKLLSLFM